MLKPWNLKPSTTTTKMTTTGTTTTATTRRPREAHQETGPPGNTHQTTRNVSGAHRDPPPPCAGRIQRHDQHASSNVLTATCFHPWTGGWLIQKHQRHASSHDSGPRPQCVPPCTTGVQRHDLHTSPTVLAGFQNFEANMRPLYSTMSRALRRMHLHRESANSQSMSACPPILGPPIHNPCSKTPNKTRQKIYKQAFRKPPKVKGQPPPTSFGSEPHAGPTRARIDPKDAPAPICALFVCLLVCFFLSSIVCLCVLDMCWCWQ